MLKVGKTTVSVPSLGVMVLTSFAFLAGQDAKPPSVPSSLPVVPFIVHFRMVPQYFVEPIPDDLHYSKIEAMIDTTSNTPWYQVIVKEKSSGEWCVYSNSQPSVDAFQHLGIDAFYKAIQFSGPDEPAASGTYEIHLDDRYGQEIIWRFVVPGKTSQFNQSFIPRPDSPGFVLLEIKNRANAGDGTSLQIGQLLHKLPASLSDSALGGTGSPSSFYGTDLIFAQIVPGTESWSVESAPAKFAVGEKWVLRDAIGHKRVLTIVRTRGDEMIINQVDQGETGLTLAQLDAYLSNKAFFLQSMIVMNSSHTLQISFNPELPLPAQGVNDATGMVMFNIDEDAQSGIASGNLSVSRYFGDENVRWQFTLPDWARNQMLNTGATILY